MNWKAFCDALFGPAPRIPPSVALRCVVQMVLSRGARGRQCVHSLVHGWCSAWSTGKQFARFHVIHSGRRCRVGAGAARIAAAAPHAPGPTRAAARPASGAMYGTVWHSAAPPPGAIAVHRGALLGYTRRSMRLLYHLWL